MKRLILFAAGLFLAACVLPGCLVHRHRGHVHGHGHVDVEVAVPVVHVHDEFCGHYYYGGVWYYSAGHRHGHGCGHVHRGGRWCRH